MSETNETPVVRTNELFEQRCAKIAEYRANGINPFGGPFADVEKISDIREKSIPEEEGAVGPESIAAGRMVAKRGMGKSIFADLRDSSGKLQLFASKSELSEADFALFKKLDIGDIIGVKDNMFFIIDFNNFIYFFWVRFQENMCSF